MADFDRIIYAKAAHRLAKETGRLMADSLIADASDDKATATKLRQLALRLQAVLEGLKKQLALPPPPKSGLTLNEAVEALRDELPKLDSNAAARCLVVLDRITAKQYTAAADLMESVGWQAPAVKLANQVVDCLRSL